MRSHTDVLVCVVSEVSRFFCVHAQFVTLMCVGVLVCVFFGVCVRVRFVCMDVHAHFWK